ncbi:MAG: hypothetical protein HFG20_05705 [Anaerotruncus sp.]|nr:hypothetical protein [Anaerotruncus sp.]
MQQKQQQQLKRAAVLLQGAVLQAASAAACLMNKRERFKTLDQIYPELFAAQKGRKVDTSRMTQQQVAKLQVETWRVFLGK